MKILSGPRPHATLTPSPSTYSQVGLQQNKIGTQAAVFMADALRLNLRLRSLGLDRNPIGVDGVNAILKSLNAMSEVFLTNLG